MDHSYSGMQDIYQSETEYISFILPKISSKKTWLTSLFNVGTKTEMIMNKEES